MRWAPPRPTRNPVITSSKISTTPCLSQSRRTSSRYPGFGSTPPPLTQIGSMITAATSLPQAVRTLSRTRASFHGSRNDSCNESLDFPSVSLRSPLNSSASGFERSPTSPPSRLSALP